MRSPVPRTEQEDVEHFDISRTDQSTGALPFFSFDLNSASFSFIPLLYL